MKLDTRTWLGLSLTAILLLGLGITAVLASEGGAAGVMSESGGISVLTLQEAGAVGGPWSPVLGDLAGGYSLAMDSGADKYLDVEALTADPALGDGDWEIYFDTLRVPDGFWIYWDGKGVNASATGQNGLMWQILNGNAPIFILQVSGTSYHLIDGLAGSGPWRINGDHPLGTYHFGGWVSDTAYLNLQMTFTQAVTVSIRQETDVVDGCGYVDVYIHLANVENLYALDIKLSFDPAVLEAVDLLPGTEGVNLLPIKDQLSEDPATYFFDAGYWIYNTVNNTTGDIRYTATQLRPAEPVSGAGDVAMIRFRAKEIGTSMIDIVNVELADPDGNQIGLPMTFADGQLGTTFSAAAGLELDIIRLNASTVQLGWPKQELDAEAEYILHRSKLPYFELGDAGVVPMDDTAFVAGVNTITFNDPVLGNVVDNYFYALQVVCENGFTSPASDQVGKFEFELFETQTTDFTWIGLIFDNPDLNKAQDLGNHIKNNLFAGSVDVLTISRWNPVAQTFTSYVYSTVTPGFDVYTKQPYRVELNIDGVTSGSVIWAQVGRVPEITQGTYTLYETATTDFNWILQPLDMVNITNTTQLAEAIEADSSGEVTVRSIARWNPIAQLFTSYVRPASSTTRFGYPYRVEVEVDIGNSVIWPDY